MKSKVIKLISILALSLSLYSCQAKYNGKIVFDLNGGSWTDPNFSSSYLEGVAGTRVSVNIPDVSKEGYYFVGWREMNPVTKAYRNITIRYDDKNEPFYIYPYGTDTFYAYFEPLSTMTFHLTTAESRNGAFVAPKDETSDFNTENGVMSGYVSKSLSSTSILPTATGDNLEFQYWYTKYPLVKQNIQKESDDGVVTHYVYDTTKEEGVYQFDAQFGTDLMEFPEAPNNNLDLYAYWKEDPKVTIHYNLDGIEDSSIQFKSDMVSKLKQKIKDVLSIDFDVTASHYFYPSKTKDYRFAGFFLNSNLVDSPFYLESPDPIKDVDVYLKWEKKVKLNFDPNGGTLSNQDVGDYYVGDTLASDFISNHTPTKEHATFLHYSVNGKKFDPSKPITSDMLDADGNLNLVAVYQDDHVLTVHFDLPTGYAGTIDDSIGYFKREEDIDAFLTAAKNKVTDDRLVIDSLYQIVNSKEVSFLDKTMPDASLTVYVKVDYKAMVEIHTLSNVSGSYVEDDSLVPVTDHYFGAASMELADLTGVTNAITLSSETYLFDGLYGDDAFGEPINFPLYLEPSHDSVPVTHLYRKMTKAAVLSFYDLSTASMISGVTLKILPGSKVSLYQNELTSLLGTYTHLYADAAKTEEISSLLPASDAILYVER